MTVSTSAVDAITSRKGIGVPSWDITQRSLTSVRALASGSGCGDFGKDECSIVGNQDATTMCSCCVTTRQLLRNATMYECEHLIHKFCVVSQRHENYRNLMGGTATK
jgi:hypothetical protein